MTIIDNIETQETSVTATVCGNAALYGAAPERGEFDSRDIWDRNETYMKHLHAIRALTRAGLI